MTIDKLTLLVWLLRLSAGVLLSAVLAIFLPTTWMESAHRWLGLGDFPDTSLTQYLTRSIACLYAMHGAVMLAVSFDVRRYRPLIQLLAVLNILFGCGLLIIDLLAGMPWFWTLLEGPPVAALGTVIYWLVGTKPTGANDSGDPES